MATLDAIKAKMDVIHYHGVGPSLLSFIPRLFAPNIKVVSTFQSIDRKHEKWNWLAKLILLLGEWAACAFAHETISSSKTITQYARDVYDCETIYIPNGVDLFEKAKNTEEIEKLGAESGKYILMTSRLIPHKGAHYLISAFQNLQKNHPEITKDFKLVIAGDGYYTDHYVSDLKQMAKNNDKIIFAGYKTGEALKQLFSHAFAMVHPSDQEGLPMSVLEAMSYGVPLILSDIPEHKELMSDSTIEFKHGNIKSLEKALADMLTSDQNKLQKMAEDNIEKIKKQYAWDIVIKDFIGVYSKPFLARYHEPTVHI
jgi:glycosyltransferase involved in cell wall biosynthesis